MPSRSLRFINISNQPIPLQEPRRMGAKKRKTINLSAQSDTHWKSHAMNDSFISAQPPRWASQRIGVQTGLSGLGFSHCSMDKCHSQRSGRCWRTWRCSFAESDSIWQCAFSPPYHPPRLRSSLHTTKSAVFAVSPNTPHFSSLLSFQGTKRVSCLSSLSAPLSQEKVWCDSGVNFASESGSMCEICQGLLAADGVACHCALTVSNVHLVGV